MPVYPPKQDIVNYLPDILRGPAEWMMGKTPAERFVSNMPGPMELHLKSPQLAGELMQAKQLLPVRIWNALTRSPTKVTLREALPEENVAYGSYNKALKRARVNPLSQDVPESIAHELTHAAQDIAGHPDDLPPGLEIDDFGKKLFKRMGYTEKEIPGEALPYYIEGPKTNPVAHAMINPEIAKYPHPFAQTLENWWPGGAKPQRGLADYLREMGPTGIDINHPDFMANSEFLRPFMR
jgi:hypothetical protein